jgi:hypothetical protein
MENRIETAEELALIEALEKGVEYRGFSVAIDASLRVVYRGKMKLCEG